MARTITNLIPASSSHFRMADVVLSGNFDITLKAWTRGAGNEIILGDDGAGTGFLACIGGVLRLNITSSLDSAAGIIEKSKYYTIRATRTGTATELFVDGVSVATGTDAGTWTINSIGSYNGGGLYWNGYIADVDLGLSTNTWALDEPTAATEDSEGGGNAVTYTNAPSTQRFVFTEDGATKWWGTNGEILELDVAQPVEAAIIWAGQSNMLSEALISAGVDDQYATFSGTQTSFGLGSQTRFGATNPLDHADEPDSAMGMWRNAMLSITGRTLHLPVADGATGFITNDWNSGDPVYNTAVASINAGLASNAGTTLKAFIWLQGETDALNAQTEAGYLSAINAMRTAMIAAITEMTTDTPWIVVEVGSALGTEDDVNAALATFAAALPKGALIPKTGLTLQDALHYDAASIRSIGEQVAVELNLLDPPATDSVLVEGAIVTGSVMTATAITASAI